MNTQQHSHIQQKLQRNKGFAMLFTVLIMSLILTLAIGISTITFKQSILTGLAKDSQIAFYEADAAVECGLYYDLMGWFPKPSTFADISANIQTQTIKCGDDVLSLAMDKSFDNYFVYIDKIKSTEPCRTVIFDKAWDVEKSKVFGLGYNICDPTPRQVERALEVRY